MAGYTIGSEKGKQIASGLKSGQTYKASDGSTWKKNSDGSVSVTTKQGGYTANALSGSSGSSSSSKSSSSSSGLGTYIDPDSGVEKSLSELPEWLGGTSNGSPAWLANADSMGGYGSNGSSGGSKSAANDYYDQAFKEQQKAIQARVNAAVDSNNAYIPQVNQQADQALQNAYILREQNMVNAPQALSAMGYSGGASETELNRIRTGYENSRNTVEQGRTQALTGIAQNEAQIRATGDATMADAASTYNQRLAELIAQQEAAAQQQSNWQSQFDFSKQQYSDAAAQQAWQNAYDERLLALKQATPKSSVSSSSAGGSGIREKSSSAPSGNLNVVLNNVQRALGGSNAGSQAAWNQAVNYIQNSAKSGLITEYEAMQLLNQLNLN